MISLNKFEKTTYLEFDDKFYLCVMNENGDLKTYFESKAIYKDEEGYLCINVEWFNNQVDRLYEYDLGKELRSLNSHRDYLDFCRHFSEFQMCLLRISVLRDSVLESKTWNEELEETITEIVQSAQGVVEETEKIFRERVCPQIPTNWAFAMFPESSWSAYEYNRQLHKIGRGATDYCIESGLGLTRSDISGNKEKMRIFDGLNQLCHELISNEPPDM